MNRIAFSPFSTLPIASHREERVVSIQANLDQLKGNAPARRRKPRSERRTQARTSLPPDEVPVARAHLYGLMFDRDIGGAHHSIGEDVDVMAGLAVRYVKIAAGVPDESGPSRWAARGREHLLKETERAGLATTAEGRNPGSNLTDGDLPDRKEAFA